MSSSVRIIIPDEIKAELDPMTIEQILDEIAKASSGELAEDIKVDWNMLRNQAKIFLSTIDSLDKEYVNVTASLLRQVVANPEIASYANQTHRRKEVYYTQSLYMLAAQFEDYLSRFREEDKQRSMLYVFSNKDGSVVESYEMTFREMILNADKSGRLGEISKKRLTNEGRKGLEADDSLFNEDHLATAQAAYEGLYNRYMRYFEVHKARQKQNAMILWKEGAQWMIGNVVNTGDLKEAYVAYLFAEHQANDLCALDPGTAPYHSHELIGGFYQGYISKVTNLEAIVEEDVLITDKQYGIKGKKAALPSLQQYIDVASIILSQPLAGLTKGDLENEIKTHFKVGDEMKGARNIAQTIEEAIDAGKITHDELVKLT